MRRITNAALAEADIEVGVVILLMRDPRRRVHEGDRLVVVPEPVSLGDFIADDGPAVQCPKEPFDGRRVKRWHTAFAGFAVLGAQVAMLGGHGSPPVKGA